jgi:hypothetical protein
MAENPVIMISITADAGVADRNSMNKHRKPEEI